MKSVNRAHFVRITAVLLAIVMLIPAFGQKASAGLSDAVVGEFFRWCICQEPGVDDATTITNAQIINGWCPGLEVYVEHDGEAVMLEGTPTKAGYFPLDVEVFYKDGSTYVLTIAVEVSEPSCNGNHDWVLVHENPASCTKGGARFLECDRCGEQTTEDTPPLGHNFELYSEKPATCTTAGEKTLMCTRPRCGEEKKEAGSPALGHNWKLVKDKPATCTAAGQKTYKCDRCEEQKMEAGSPALGHNWKLDKDKPATCTTAGEKTYKCGRCTSQKTEAGAAALGHSWSAWADTGSGSEARSCSRCKETESRTGTATTSPDVVTLPETETQPASETASGTEGSEATESQAPPATTEPKATSPATTQAQKPTEPSTSKTNGEEGSSSTVLYIVIGVSVLAVCGTVILLVLTKRRK